MPRWGPAFVLGLRHGFDYDHLAAISDITAVQRNWRSGLRLGVTYALGHAFMVAALGVMVLEMRVGLPEGLDHWTERLIGLTLIVLGIGVVAGILRKDAHGHHQHGRIESRLAIGINGLLWAAWRMRRLWNREAPQPERFQWLYTGKSVFAIGMLHGIGAETPSQLALFFLAKSLGGTGNGMMGLAAFCLGPGGHERPHDRLAWAEPSRRGAFHPRFYHAIAWTGAVYSFGIGLIFLFGISSRLPQLG